MDTSQFKGVWTALITPFTNDHKIDWEALTKLIEHQIAGGVTGIVVLGTTGESPTITSKEATKLIKRAKKIINGRCLLMAGTGSNCTQTSIEKSIKAEKAGADCLLVVNPYYNKPTQHGLYLHFKAVADSTKLPIFLYNIKGRTGVNLETETLLQLTSDCPNIIGVKEASGDIEQIKDVCQKRPEGFIVLSGDDGITYQIMKDFGADGVVSVASNIIPGKLTQMVNNLESQLNDEIHRNQSNSS